MYNRYGFVYYVLGIKGTMVIHVCSLGFAELGNVMSLGASTYIYREPMYIRPVARISKAEGGGGSYSGKSGH